jgi:transposase
VPAGGPVGRPGREGLRPDRDRAVREWVKQAERDAGTRQDGGLTGDERRELAEPRRENCRLREDVGRMWRS